MASAICRQGPWNVEVLPCRLDKPICGRPVARETTFFYLCDTFPFKSGICLSFTQFEQAVLRLEKVGWSSLSNRVRRLLLKSFRESYKFFKDRFFRVYHCNFRPNLLVDPIGEPFSHFLGPCHRPLYPFRTQSHEEENAPLTTSTQPTITDAPTVQVVSAHPIVVSHPQPAISTEDILVLQVASTPLIVVSNPQPTTFIEDVPASEDSKPIDTTTSCEGASRKRPREVIEETSGEVASPTTEDWRSIVVSHLDNPSVWNRKFPLFDVVDHHMATSLDIDTVDILRLPNGLKMLQAYSSYSFVLAQTLERRFGELGSLSKKLAEAAHKFQEENMKLKVALHVVEESL
ncbi:hypothetical protein CR513_59417, partial [Mucuna pruriens]